jgi:hypothetical protein
MLGLGKFRKSTWAAAVEFPPHTAATVCAVATHVTIPFPDDLFEALAQRVADLLAERPPAERYLDTEAAAVISASWPKTLRTKGWRDREGVPYSQLDSGQLVFDRLALDERFASCSGEHSSARATVVP